MREEPEICPCPGFLARASACLAVGDLAGLAGVLTERYGESAPSITDRVLDGDASGVTGTDQQAVFLRSAAMVARARATGTAHHVAPPARRLIGVDHDFLGERLEPANWSLGQTLNWLLLREVAPTRRVAAVVPMRDDGLHILEWIAHHRTIGIEGIFIYTNDNADGSEQLLRCLADHGVISLIESETSGEVRPEVKAFEHALHLVHELRDFEWALFVDSDEFLMPAPHHRASVPLLLDALDAADVSDRASAILFSWLWFNSNMVFMREPRPLVERFQHASAHWLTKPLVRVRDVLSMRLQHMPELVSERVMVDSAFRPVEPAKMWEQHAAEYGGGRINHYWPKSFEEFSLKKARGDTIRMTDNEYRRDFRLFFQWNGPDTPETYHPPDAAFVASLHATLSALRALPGVAALEAEATAGFRRLVSRYDAVGGLAAIYAAADPRTARGEACR